MIKTAPAAVAGLTLTEVLSPRQAFGIRITPPPTPTAEVSAYYTGQNNLSSKLYGTGASAADFRQAWVTLNTLFATLQSNGTQASIDSALKSQSSAINSFDPETYNPQTLLSIIQKAYPSVQLPAVVSAMSQVNSSAASSLITNGTVPAINNYVAALQSAESYVGSGVATAAYGIRRGGHAVEREVICVLAIYAGSSR